MSGLSKRANWCDRHHCEHTGFTNMYCPQCVVEQEALLTEGTRPIKLDIKPDLNRCPTKWWIDVRPGEGWDPNNIKPSSNTNFAATPTPWSFEGNVVDYKSYSILKSGYWHIFEVDLQNNRRGSPGLAMVYLKDSEMTEIANYYRGRFLQCNGFYVGAGQTTPLHYDIPPHTAPAMPGIYIKSHIVS